MNVELSTSQQWKTITNIFSCHLGNNYISKDLNVEKLNILFNIFCYIQIGMKLNFLYWFFFCEKNTKRSLITFLTFSSKFQYRKYSMLYNFVDERMLSENARCLTLEMRTISFKKMDNGFNRDFLPHFYLNWNLLHSGLKFGENGGKSFFFLLNLSFFYRMAKIPRYVLTWLM